jgi:hypothetical protein
MAVGRTRNWRAFPAVVLVGVLPLACAYARYWLRRSLPSYHGPYDSAALAIASLPPLAMVTVAAIAFPRRDVYVVAGAVLGAAVLYPTGFLLSFLGPPWVWDLGLASIACLGALPGIVIAGQLEGSCRAALRRCLSRMSTRGIGLFPALASMARGGPALGVSLRAAGAFVGLGAAAAAVRVLSPAAGGLDRWSLLGLLGLLVLGVWVAGVFVVAFLGSFPKTDRS